MRLLLAMAVVCALLAPSVLAPLALAEGDAAEREARDAFAHELALCVAYYLVVAEAYRRHEESASARAHTAVANKLLDRAVELADEEAVMLHAKQAMRDFFRMVGQDLGGMPRLAAQYGPSCALCYDYPDTVLETWRKHMAR